MKKSSWGGYFDGILDTTAWKYVTHNSMSQSAFLQKAARHLLQKELPNDEAFQRYCQVEDQRERMQNGGKRT